MKRTSRYNGRIVWKQLYENHLLTMEVAEMEQDLLF